MAAPAGTDAVAVLGQSAFTLNAANFVDGSGMEHPRAVALDTVAAAIHVYVADFDNSRVLGWASESAFASDAPADIVIGQADFNSYACNRHGGATATTLCTPAAVAVDGAERVYIADTGNNRVLVYPNPFQTEASTGQHAGFAAGAVFGQQGNLTSATANLGGISADSLWAPQGLATDPSGDLFVLDSLNNRVLLYFAPMPAAGGTPGTPGAASDTTADVVFGQGGSFIAGLCNQGGAASASTLCFGGANGLGLAIDTSSNLPGGNLFVADSANDRALEFNGSFGPSEANNTTAHLVFTSGTAQLAPPFGTAVDGSGNFFVSYSAIGQVYVYESAVALSNTTPNLKLGFSAGAPNAASLAFPEGLGVDGLGHLLIADAGNHRALVYNSPLTSGSVASAVAGQRDFVHVAANFVDAIGLSNPGAAAIDESSGAGHPAIYIADTANNRVLGWVDVASFAAAMPADIVIGQSDVYSYLCNRGPSAPPSASTLCTPTGVAVDGGGNLYVADSGNHRVLEFAAPILSGTVAGQSASVVLGQTSAGNFTAHNCNNRGVASASTMCEPYGVALDAGGHLYVADAANNRVLEFDAPLGGTVAANRVFGQSSMSSGGCNAGTAGGDVGGLGPDSLCFPVAAAADPAGNLYVADQKNHRVLEYDTPLATDTIADRVFGQGGMTSNQANMGGATSDASLDSPAGVATDFNGNLYVADSGNHRVLEYDTPLSPSSGEAGAGDSLADLVFGQNGNFTTNQPNEGADAGDAIGLGPDSLNAPLGVALDSAGNLYVTDAGNNRMLKYAMPVAIPTPTATLTPTISATATATVTASVTLTATATHTATATLTSTASPSKTPTATRTRSGISATPTSTHTATRTPTATATIDPSSTATPTGSPTKTASHTPTPSPSHTATATATKSPTPTFSRRTPTPSVSMTATQSFTPSRTPTPSQSSTPTASITGTATRTATATATGTPTPTAGRTRVASATPSATATARFR